MFVTPDIPSDRSTSSDESDVWSGNDFLDETNTFTGQIKAYMNGNATLEETAKLLVEPINAAYTSADDGQAYRHAEDVARTQREYYPPEESAEMWGLPIPDEELPQEDRRAPSAESGLWGLWGTILSIARSIPWDNPGQDRLVDIVRAIKEQPEPDPPVMMTRALQRDWIWSSGRVWSNLLLFGPSAREDWNDSPGFGIGFEKADIYAWTNVNAFIARITAEGIRDFWIYAIWALREGLEDRYDSSSSRDGVSKTTKLNASTAPAAVWVLVLGKALHDREEDLTSTDPHHGQPAQPGNLFKERGGRPEFGRERWAFWKERFAEISHMQKISDDARNFASAAYQKMEDVEKEA